VFEAVTCRPADKIEPEMDIIEKEFDKIVAEKNITLVDNKIDDLLIYALFPQVGISFLENRNIPSFFEPIPTALKDSKKSETEDGVYTVSFKGNSYTVQVSAGGEITSMQPVSGKGNSSSAGSSQKKIVNDVSSNAEGEAVEAPLSGNIRKVMVELNQEVAEGDVLVILEAMKMETEIQAIKSGTVSKVYVSIDDSVNVDQ
jgi:oxaloacetate decarboxylase alpha subunit